MEYFSLQEQMYHLAQRNLPVPSSLRRQMQELSDTLNSEESKGATEATEFDIEDGGFEPYVAWSPDTDAENSDSEEAARAAEEKDQEIESEYYSFNQKLARLEEVLERRGATVKPSAIQAIFPRMLATRAYGNYHYRFLIKNAGIEEPSLQVFTLSLWAHQADLAHPHLPDDKQLMATAEVVAASIEVARQWFNTAHAKRPAKVQEVLEAVADELDLSVAVTVERMQKFLDHETQYPSRNFGRLIFNFLGANDDLFPIHDSESLDRFISRE